LSLATVNDPADPLLTDEDSQFLEREILDNVLMAGDQAALFSLLAVLSGNVQSDEIAGRIDDIHTQYKLGKPDEVYLMTGIVLINSAPFHGPRAKRLVDALMDETRGLDEETRLAIANHLLEAFEQCLLGVPHHSGWRIQIGHVLGG
jgi:hypothetical protein